MKKLILVLCLLLLVSCGSDDSKKELSGDTNAPVTETQQGDGATDTTEEKEEAKTEDVKKEEGDITPSDTLPERTPEQQVVDKTLITLLREQLDGAYDVKGATFTYTCIEQLDGKECFAYKMEKDGQSETFAVATDSSAIYHLEGKDFVKIFG